MAGGHEVDQDFVSFVIFVIFLSFVSFVIFVIFVIFVRFVVRRLCAAYPIRRIPATSIGFV
jgi:hypothetical protein